jgi:protein TonB
LREWSIRRGTVLAALGVLHVAVILALAHMSKHDPLPVVAHSVEVRFLAARPEAARPPLPKPVLSAVRVPEMPLPVLAFPLDTPQPPTAITMMAKAEPLPATSSESVIEVAAVEYLQAPAPRYPVMARRARAQGVVLVRVMIDTEGRPCDVRVNRSSGFQLLDNAAREAVQHWVFKPHRENGIARNALVTIPIEFSLNMRTAAAG